MLASTKWSSLFALRREREERDKNKKRKKEEIMILFFGRIKIAVQRRKVHPNILLVSGTS